MTINRKSLVLGGALSLSVLALSGAAFLGYFDADPVSIVRPESRRMAYKAIFLSGDLGLRVGMGPKIVRHIVEAGMPVVGFNSLTFFRTRRSRGEVVQMVQGLMARADTEFGPGPMVLIGQSFGADALQLGLERIPPGRRENVALVALIVPTDSVYLRASPNEMLNFAPADISAIDTARELLWSPVLCIQGIGEDKSLCPLLSAKNVKHVSLPGGHLLNGDAKAVADKILAALADARHQQAAQR